MSLIWNSWNQNVSNLEQLGPSKNVLTGEVATLWWLENILLLWDSLRFVSSNLS